MFGEADFGSEGRFAEQGDEDVAVAAAFSVPEDGKDAAP